MTTTAASKNDRWFDRLNAAFFAIVLLIVAYPLYFILIASISSPEQVNAGLVWLWPVDVSLDGYKKLLDTSRIWQGYLNTIIYATVGTAISVIVTVLGAYALSRKDLPFRTVILFPIVLTMFFSGGLIPIYLQIKGLNLLDTMWAVILPQTVTAFQLIIARSFFQSTIPDELLEAAQMDGCNNTKFFLKIAAPLSLPIIAVLVLFSFVSHWNAYFNALIYLKNQELYPLQLVLREILIQNQAADLSGGDVLDQLERQRLGEMIKYSAIIVASVPLLVLYPFVQKYFVQGVMVGSIKG
jgi:putative aldouronate transport system permease protein